MPPVRRRGSRIEPEECLPPRPTLTGVEVLTYEEALRMIACYYLSAVTERPGKEYVPEAGHAIVFKAGKIDRWTDAHSWGASRTATGVLCYHVTRNRDGRTLIKRLFKFEHLGYHVVAYNFLSAKAHDAPLSTLTDLGVPSLPDELRVHLIPRGQTAAQRRRRKSESKASSSRTSRSPITVEEPMFPDILEGDRGLSWTSPSPFHGPLPSISTLVQPLLEPVSPSGSHAQFDPLGSLTLPPISPYRRFPPRDSYDQGQLLRLDL